MRKIIENSPLGNPFLPWIDYFLLSLLRNRRIISPPLADLYIKDGLSQIKVTASLNSSSGISSYYKGNYKNKTVFIHVEQLNEKSCAWERNVGGFLSEISNPALLPMIGFGFFKKENFGLETSYAFIVFDYPTNDKILSQILLEDKKLFDDKKSLQLPFKTRFKIAIAMTLGVQRFHDRGMGHGKIEVTSTFLDENNQPQFFDLSACTRISQGGFLGGFEAASTRIGDCHIGINRWAPEILKGSSLNSLQAVDIYAIGFFLFDLFTFPMVHNRLDHLDASFIPGLSLEIELNIKALIRHCLDPDAHKRPVISEVLHELQQIAAKLAVQPVFTLSKNRNFAKMVFGSKVQKDRFMNKLKGKNNFLI